MLNLRWNATINGNSAHVNSRSRQKLCVKNCGQTAADRDTVTYNSLQELVIALFNGTIADPLQRTV